MTAGRAAAWTVLVLVLAAALGAAAFFLPGWLAQNQEAPPPAESAPRPAARHIKATLYYVSEDGLRLVPTEREVPFGEGLLEQARRLLEAELKTPDPPLNSAIPPGTSVKAVYLGEKGEAFADLSPEVSSAHPGGALTELLTVYSVVNVLTTNLPAVTSVQILVDGHEVDTLAGHVDLRRPLPGSTLMVQQPPSPGAAAPASAPQPASAAAPDAKGTAKPAAPQDANR
jgi:hypothetical protein